MYICVYMAQDILEQVRGIKESFHGKFEELNNSIKDLKRDTRTILNRVCNAEKRIGTLEDLQSAHEESIKDLTKEVKNLKSKVTYLESHSRRNNLVLRGLEECLLETDDPGKEMGEILRYNLDNRPGARDPQTSQKSSSPSKLNRTSKIIHHTHSKMERPPADTGSSLQEEKANLSMCTRICRCKSSRGAQSMLI